MSSVCRERVPAINPNVNLACSFTKVPLFPFSFTKYKYKYRDAKIQIKESAQILVTRSEIQCKSDKYKYKTT